jgi:hypothetical protein
VREALGAGIDKHYAAVPQELLDEAVTWLGSQLLSPLPSPAPESP